MVLERELAHFEKHRLEWLDHHRGKFALIHGEHLEDTYDTPEAAYQAGIKLWGNVPFLIKQILPEDPIEQSPALMYGLLHASS